MQSLAVVALLAASASAGSLHAHHHNMHAKRQESASAYLASSSADTACGCTTYTTTWYGEAGLVQDQPTMYASNSTTAPVTTYITSESTEYITQTITVKPTAAGSSSASSIAAVPSSSPSSDNMTEAVTTYTTTMSTRYITETITLEPTSAGESPITSVVTLPSSSSSSSSSSDTTTTIRSTIYLTSTETVQPSSSADASAASTSLSVSSAYVAPTSTSTSSSSSVPIESFTYSPPSSSATTTPASSSSTSSSVASAASSSATESAYSASSSSISSSVASVMSSPATESAYSASSSSTSVASTSSTMSSSSSSSTISSSGAVLSSSSSSSSTSAAPSSYAAPSSSWSQSTSVSSTSTSASASATASTIPINGTLWAMTYTPYATDGTCMTADEVSSDVASIKAKGFTTVRIYGTDCSGLANVGAACAANGLKIILGVYIDDSGIGSNTDEQVSAIISWGQESGNWDMVEMVVFGNEAIFNNYASASALAGAISSVKGTLSAAGYSGTVTTTEPLDIMTDNADTICPVVDVIAGTIHPFFDDEISSSQAGSYVATSLTQLAALCNNEKEAYSLESGWPWKGDTNGAAVPSPEDQKTAIAGIVSSAGSRTAIFSFENDAWKSPGEFDVEQYWGCADLFAG